MNAKIRLVKIISHLGFCSRRKAEILIKEGKVKLDGKPYTDHLIKEDNIPRITVENKKIFFQKIRLWCFHKSVGLVCSNNKQFNNTTIFEILPKNLPRMLSVGRLDMNSEGLLLLTNNPTLSSFLEHPKNKIKRKYLVKIIGEFRFHDKEKYEKSLNIEGVHYASRKIKVIENKKKQSKIEIILEQGKNKEIRRIMNYFNLKVMKLKRIEYGPFKLHNIKKNEISEVSENFLKKQLKKMGFKDENNFWKI